jgi:hypothetical protein
MWLRTRSIPTLVVGLWALSWLALYLEIVRYHHVSLTHLGGILWTSGGGVQPGIFVRAVVVCSVLAPLCAALLSVRNAQARGSIPRVALAPLILGVGALVAVLGAVNQLVRRPPLGFDLTLRTGNGGFIVIGLVLVAGALVATARRRQRNAATRHR